MSQQVIVEVHRVLGHFQAEDAEQELGFFVEGAEVLQYVGVEGGAIGAHLQITAQLEITPSNHARQRSEVT